MYASSFQGTQYPIGKVVSAFRPNSFFYSAEYLKLLGKIEGELIKLEILLNSSSTSRNIWKINPYYCSDISLVLKYQSAALHNVTKLVSSYNVFTSHKSNYINFYTQEIFIKSKSKIFCPNKSSKHLIGSCIKSINKALLICPKSDVSSITKMATLLDKANVLFHRSN